MSKVRLELHELKIKRIKKRWRIYFVIATEHPTEADKMLLTAMPSQPIRMLRINDNVLELAPEGEGADGMILFEREMPADRSVKARLWVRHSRSRTRGAAEVLSDLKEELGTDVFDVLNVVPDLASAAPWLVVAKTAVKSTGGILSRIKDRDLGTVFMDEEFNDEFLQDGELDRVGGNGAVQAVWTWSVED